MTNQFLSLSVCSFNIEIKSDLCKLCDVCIEVFKVKYAGLLFQFVFVFISDFVVRSLIFSFQFEFLRFNSFRSIFKLLELRQIYEFLSVKQLSRHRQKRVSIIV